MVTAAHLWPGLTPTYIGETLPWRDWRVFAVEVDRWLAEQERARREAERGRR